MKNTITNKEAEEIIAKYINKAGRRPQIYYEAQKILGFDKTPSKSNKTTSNKVTGNRILKNETIGENEKFRYVRMKEIAEINTTPISADAHHLLLVLMTSPSSNALGAFQISINEMCAQTGGRSKEAITTALEELIQLKKVRYINNCLYITDFHNNQKTHGNADNLRGVFKLYNNLNDNQKLPYIGSISFDKMNMDELISEFEKLVEGIQIMSIIDSGDTTIDIRNIEVYTTEQLEAIYSDNKRTFASTNEVNTLAQFKAPESAVTVSHTSNDDDNLQPQLVELSKIVDDKNISKSNQYSDHELFYKIHDATGLPIEKIYKTPLGDQFLKIIKSDKGLEFLEKNKTFIEENTEEIIAELFPMLGNSFIENNQINEEITTLILLGGYQKVIETLKEKLILN
ncbi:hypothetical protein HX088_11225 [Empedobacter sp. 225-1]|uniref:hypothetical protein n=1 Tax=Empedobacter sp. 225-1 TaxID=2746725 RepID=UPI002576D6BD|nr:hypothetical protein [Empedobacter sp. 225-1]MDM1523837.1 hypothetical protein [Empedobacter sp. 225-1]